MNDETTQQELPKTVRETMTEDFASVYANNFHFELSYWDLKIILGQLDQSRGNQEVDWHTSVTMPWSVAKLFSYLLRLNIAIYESNNGPIRLPESALPAAPVAPTGDQDTEQNREFYEFMVKIHRQLVGTERTL
jgi:hypothetical protein